MTSRMLLAFISFLAFAPSAPRAAGPTEQLSATLNEFVRILNNTPVAELQATGLPQSAQRLVFARFDFSEMTKRSLGSHWQSLNQREQTQFVDAFTQRLLISYGKTVRSGEDKIHYKREVQDGKQASVETTIVGGKGGELSVDYQLHDIDGQWKVYDVLIDHVSLVNNFRSQFQRVINKSSLKELLEKVKQQDS